MDNYLEMKSVMEHKENLHTDNRRQKLHKYQENIET